MTASIKVEGLKKLRRELKTIESSLPKQLNDVGRSAAELVADAARDLAPRLTGTLAGRIKPGVSGGGSYVAVRGLVYGPPIHWGWAKHGISPNPFLYHALDERRAEVVARFAVGVAALIDSSITPGTGE